MIWLPGSKVPGQDINNEEYADQQMNFGFALGDEGINEPYFYITAYPGVDAFASLSLPAGASWHSEGFNGVLLSYSDLLAQDNPEQHLLDLWTVMYAAGRGYMSA